MQRKSLVTVALSSLLLFSSFACGKKDMSARRGPQATEPVVVNEKLPGDPMEIPGYPAYRLQPLRDFTAVQELHSTLRKDLGRDIWNMCSDRAAVWSYEMWKNQRVTSGKIFLFYTLTEVRGADGRTRLRRNTGNPANRPWIWHAAPYVAAGDGQLYMMENFQYVNRPITVPEWIKLQSNGAQCEEITDANKDVLKWTCGTLTADGQCTDGVPRMIRVPEGGAPCYYRRTPMYYQYPRDVANHDYLNKPERTDWDLNEIFLACKLSMSGDDVMRGQKCYEIINGTVTDDVAPRDWLSEVLKPESVPPFARAENPEGI